LNLKIKSDSEAIRKCLFCDNESNLRNREHIIPESLGNKTLILRNRVCCNCNNTFSQLDEYFCHNHFGVLEKLHYLKKTKKGNMPFLPLQNGRAQTNKNGVIKFERSIKSATNDFKMTFTDKTMVIDDSFPLNPIDTTKISRFLAKCGIEILYLRKKEIAYQNCFDDIREYAKTNSNGIFIPFLWKKNDIKNINALHCNMEFKKNGNFQFSFINLPGCEYWFPLNRFNENIAFEALSKIYYLTKVEKPELIERKIDFTFEYESCLNNTEEIMAKCPHFKIEKSIPHDKEKSPTLGQVLPQQFSIPWCDHEYFALRKDEKGELGCNGEIGKDSRCPENKY